MALAAAARGEAIRLFLPGREGPRRGPVPAAASFGAPLSAACVRRTRSCRRGLQAADATPARRCMCKCGKYKPRQVVRPSFITLRLFYFKDSCVSIFFGKKNSMHRCFFLLYVRVSWPARISSKLSRRISGVCPPGCGNCKLV
jgi:hypothetical protein